MLRTMPSTQSFGTKSLSDMQAFGMAAIFHLSLVAAVSLVSHLPKASIEPVRPIEVRLIHAEKTAPVQAPVVVPPKPQPVVKKPVTQNKPLPVVPQTAVQTASTPVTLPPQAAASSTAPSETAPLPYTEAIFNASYLNNPKPIYPPAARRRGETGTVFLRVHVDEAGVALEVEIKTSSGSEFLDRSAKEAVAKWRFAPAKRGTSPVASWVLVPIQFSLNEE